MPTAVTLAPLSPHVAWTSWQFDPVVTVLLCSLSVGYLVAVRRVGTAHPQRPWPMGRSACFLLGIVAVGIATESSVAVYDDTLFAMHMVQHLLLLMVAPPLLVFGRPITLVLHAWGNPLHRAIKQAVRSRAAFALTYPPVVTVLFAGTIVGTHTAPVMNAVVRHGWAHDAEHAWYVMAGYMFFLVVVGSEPLRRRRSLPARFLMLVLVMPVDAVVGVALMLFAHPVYASYLERRRSWGPTVLSDQHLGGALMWMVGDAIMASLLLVIAAVFVSGADRGRARDRLDRPGTDNDARLAAYNDYLSTSS